MSDTLAVMPVYIRTEQDANFAIKAAESFVETTSGAELLVVDDGSPGNQDFLVALEGVTVEKLGQQYARLEKNGGFAHAVNIGLRRARERGLNALTLNADMIFKDNGWLDHLRQNPADVVGGLLTYPNGLVQHAGVFFSIINRRFDHIYRMAPKTLAQVHEPRICPVTGAMMLIKHETLKKIGVFDENFHFGYEDVDYCHMVFQAGMMCAYEPQAEAMHWESWFAAEPGKKHREWMQDGWNYLHEKHRGVDFSGYIPTMIWED